VFHLRWFFENRLLAAQIGQIPHSAAATLRDETAQAEVTGSQHCILSSDLSHAFDMISHEYLFCILHEYGFSTQFITYIKNIYNDASSHIHINGHASDAIQIRRGVWQGYPLSMILFTLCLNPLIWRLERDLQGIDIAGKAKTAVVAYADDMTIFLTDPRGIRKLEESLQWYARASGATLNVKKSKAMALGTYVYASHTRRPSRNV